MWQDELIELYEALDEFRQRRYQLMVGWFIFLCVAVIFPYVIEDMMGWYGVGIALVILMGVFMLTLTYTIKNETRGHDVRQSLEQLKTKLKNDELRRVAVGDDGELVEIKANPTNAASLNGKQPPRSSQSRERHDNG